jgi:hypothetical protein
MLYTLLAIVLQRIGKILNGLKLIAGYIAGGSAEQRRNAVYNRGAGMLNGGGLHNVELGPGLAEDFPITHIAVIGAIDLADGLLFNGDALHGLNGNNGGHADGVAGLDILAESFAVDILVYDARHMLLRNALDGKAKLVADSLGGVPSIGRLKLGRMGNLLFELGGSKVTAMRLGKGDAVFIHIVAVRALYLGDVMAAGRYKANHIYPEYILHAAAGNGAAIFLGKSIELIDHGGGGGPGIYCLFAGGNYIYAATYALLDGFVNIADKAAGGDDGNIGIALIKNLFGIVRDYDAGLDAKLGPITYILTYGRAVAYAAYYLSTMLIGITKGVFAHLSATILNDLDLIHDSISFSFCVPCFKHCNGV